jgi:hypothetical protein
MLTSIPVQAASIFTAGKPARILSTAYYTANNRPFDVSSDGQRFLLIKENSPAGLAPVSASIVVVLNWFGELEKLVP